jgi:iron complex outermembrane receptor protein
MHVRSSRKSLSPVALAVLAALASAPAARAQEAAVATGALEEIIVTAQKREQNLQEVPVAVSVVTGDLIDRSAALNIEGITAMVPSLNFRKGGTTINSTLFLRGVGTVTTSLAAEPSVSTVLDGVVLGRMGEAFGDLVDVQRIEVLRGPQGSLFGKNASAGVVHVISNMPEPEFGASAQVEYYDGEEYKVRGILNAPINDTLSTRLTAFYGEYDGNIRNLYNGDDINGYERYGVRGIALWDPSEDVRVTFIGDYRKADDDCCGEVIGSVPAGATQAAFLSLLQGVNLRGDETREVRHNLVTATEEEAWGLSAQVDWDVGEHVLTSITAYRAWDAGEVREGDWLDQPAAYVGNGFAQLHDDGPQEAKTFSQELRLASPVGQFLEYVVGAFYYDAETDRDFLREVINCTASTLPVDATGQQPCAPGASTFTLPESSAAFGSESTNWSIFGQSTLNFTDSIRGLLGLRWTNDELSFYHDRVPSPVAGPGVRTDLSGFRGETDNDDFSGNIGVQWDVSDEIMTYAKYSRGYKGPAFNVFFNQNPTQLNPIEAETSDAFEIGLKATVFDGTTTINLALFDATYDNFQANAFDVLNGAVITRLTNAGEISTSGVELDFVSAPFEGLTLSGGFAFTDAQIEEFNLPPNSPPGAGNLSGERLPFAPEFKGSLMAEYRWEAFAGYDMFVNGSASYTDEQYTDLPNAVTGPNPLLLIDSYTLIDASIGVSPQSNAWRLTLVGKNLSDESYASLLTPGGPGGSVRMLIPREADSYWGVQFRMNFAGAR